MAINLPSGGVLVGTAAGTFTIVEYAGSWPARPALPDGYAVLWINRTNSTQPPAGVDGYVIDLDISLCALTEA